MISDEPMHSSFPPYYFLIEESARELSSRILLGTVAARQGMTTCIIPQWLAWKRFDALPMGIVVFKGNNGIQTRHMRAARAAGHLVAAIEEEALGVSLSSEIARLFDPDTEKACDLLFVQGEHVKDIVTAKFPNIASRVVVTGNPRIDLLRSPFSTKILAEGRDIQRTHGDYILVNTNIASINPRTEDTYAYFNMCRQVGVIDPDQDQDWLDFLEWCAWERGNLDLLTKVIGAYLSRKKRLRLVIRPHPSENTAKWREAYRDVEGVSVILDGDHAPWTAGARLLLHTGCTTGLEATLLGTPTISLQGNSSHWNQVHTSNHVNPTATSLDQATALIDRILSDEAASFAPTKNERTALERHVLPWPNDLAANQIIHALRELGKQVTGHAPEEPTISRTSIDDYQASEDKIIPTSFTTDAVSKVAAEIALALGHEKPPIVGSSAPGAITISPAQ